MNQKTELMKPSEIKRMFSYIKEGDIIVFQSDYMKNSSILDVESKEGTYIHFRHALNFRGKDDEKDRIWYDDGIGFSLTGEGFQLLRYPTYGELLRYATLLSKEYAHTVEFEREENCELWEEIKQKTAEADYWKKEADAASTAKAQEPADNADTIDFDFGVDDYNAADDKGKTAMLNNMSNVLGRIASVFMNMVKNNSIEIAFKPSGEERLVVKAMRDGALDDYRENTGKTTEKQKAFRAYLKDVMELFRKTKSLRGQTDFAKKHGVTAITKEQFYDFKLNDAEYFENQGGNLYADHIYEEVKKK